MQPTSYTISSLWTLSVFVDAGYKHKQVKTCCFSWSPRRKRLLSSNFGKHMTMTCPDKAWPKTRGNVMSLTRRIAFHVNRSSSKNSHFQNEAKCKPFLDDALMSETSGVKTGRRKVDDSSKKKTDFSFFKKKTKNDSFQSFLDELGLHNVNVSQIRSFRASCFYTRRWSRLLSACERRKKTLK